MKIQARGTALGSRLSALGSRLSALGSRLSALGSRLSALGSRLSALTMRANGPRCYCQAFFRAIHDFFQTPRRCNRGNRARKAAGPIVLNIVPCRFQKRPMKPAYRASSMCRKTLTAEIQCGTSNVSTSDPFPFPDSLCEPQAACKTQRICPMEHFNLAKFAAPFPARLLAPLAETTARSRRLQCYNSLTRAGKKNRSGQGAPHPGQAIDQHPTE